MGPPELLVSANATHFGDGAAPKLQAGAGCPGFNVWLQLVEVHRERVLR